MKRSDKLRIAFMNIKKDKTKYMVGSLFVVSVVIIIFSFSIYKFFMTIISDEENNFYYHRFFMYYDDYETRDFESVKIDALSVEHVVLVLSPNYSETSVYLDELNGKLVKKDVLLVSSTSDISLNISKGRNLENNNEIVCPVNFYPYDDLEYNKNITNKDVINMTKYLNDTLEFTYENSDGTSNTSSFKLVGVYRNSLFDWDEDRCFVLDTDISVIEKNKGNDLDLVYDEESGDFSFPILLIDDVSYLEEIKDNLSQYGIYIEGTYKHDELLYSLLPFLVTLIVIICSLASIVILILLTNKKIKNNRGYLSLLKTFGYNNKDITEILLYENIILNLIYVLIGIVITLLIYFILKLIIYFRPFYFGKISITYSIISIPVCLLIALLLAFISILFFKREIQKLNIINILREDD